MLLDSGSWHTGGTGLLHRSEFLLKFRTGDAGTENARVIENGAGTGGSPTLLYGVGEYVTVVVDHHRGDVIWASGGKKTSMRAPLLHGASVSVCVKVESTALQLFFLFCLAASLGTRVVCDVRAVV